MIISYEPNCIGTSHTKRNVFFQINCVGFCIKMALVSFLFLGSTSLSTSTPFIDFQPPQIEAGKI